MFRSYFLAPFFAGAAVLATLPAPSAADAPAHPVIVAQTSMTAEAQRPGLLPTAAGPAGRIVAVNAGSPPNQSEEKPMPASAMASDAFWRIIDRYAQSDDPSHSGMLAFRQALHALSLEEIITFEVAFRRYLNRAYTWDLWGAAYVIHGGCSDDGFEYFRRWLVSRGREAYEAALADPDSLAEFKSEPTGADGVWEFEEFYYVALEVFREKGGQGDVRDYSEPEAGLGGPPPGGEPFVEDIEHLKKRYPKLWKRFGSAPLP
jgi:Protein of unknown function (DUF4240)